MRRPFAAFAVLGTAAAVFSLAGCGGSSPNPSGTSPVSIKTLPAAEKAEFVSAMQGQVEGTVEDFITLKATGGLTLSRVSNAPIGRLLAARSVRPFASAIRRHISRHLSPGCATTPAGDTLDTDHDGVLDTVSTTFACSVVDTLSATDIVSLDLTGSIVEGDPTINTPDIDYDLTFQNFALNSSDSSGTFDITLNGSNRLQETPGLIGDTGSVSFSEQITNDTAANGTVSIAEQIAASYAFAGDSLITFFGNTPPGTFNLNGSWTFDVNTTKAKANLTFTVSTLSPGLSINPQTCSVSSGGNAGGIVSGTVTAKFSDGSVVTFVWASCPTTPSWTIT